MRIIFSPVFGSTNVEGLSSGFSTSSSTAAGFMRPKRLSTRLLVAFSPGVGDGEGAGVADAPGDAAGAAPDGAGVDGAEEQPAATARTATREAKKDAFTESPNSARNPPAFGLRAMKRRRQRRSANDGRHRRNSRAPTKSTTRSTTDNAATRPKGGSGAPNSAARKSARRSRSGLNARKRATKPGIIDSG